MVRVLIGDLFSSEAQTLVNTVNCVGVMGKGVALEFKARFPEMYAHYVRRCAAGQVRLGEPYVYRHLLPPWVLNFPTKDHWRSVSRLSDIVQGLEHLKANYKAWGITSLAVPPLGCGQGQLDWKVELYAPFGTPEAELQESFLTRHLELGERGDEGGPRIDPAWVALVVILDRIVQEPYHWPVGRTTLQKIAYFATEEGLPTGLAYERGSFGPFASDLKPLVTRLVNHGLIQEQQLGRMFAVKPGPTYLDARSVFKSHLEQWDPLIDKVADLFLRMRTQQAEVAATIHFSARALAKHDDQRPTEADVLEEVKRWKQRRRPPLSEDEVARGIRSLNLLGWVSLRPTLDLPLPEDQLVDA
jgi:O-acetyl-ADP-ribose deacetylase (regulator of RNase III)